MPRRKTPALARAPVTLDVLEYKFDGCPDEELFDCRSYEFARESEWTKTFVATHPADRLLELARSSDPSCAFLAFSQWPTHPYLSIEPAERKRLVRLLGCPPDKELGANFFQPATGPKGILNTRERMEIELDWLFPDRLILEFFKAYLEVKRPSSIRPIDYRGRNTSDARTRRQLKYLGMFRLLKVHSNANAAHKAFGQKLGLSRVDAWYRARNCVEFQIKVLTNGMESRFGWPDLQEHF
jgi:hypothetical protein